MARDESTVELQALRDRIAALEEQLAQCQAEISQWREHAAERADTFQRELGTLTAERDALRERRNALEGVCTNIRSLLDQDAPEPRTDIQAAVDEFIAKVGKR